MKVNGDGIRGTGACPQKFAWGRCTRRPTADGSTLYLHVFDWPADGKLVVPGAGKVASATLLATGKRLAVKSAVEAATISVPTKAPDPISSTIVLKVKAPLAAN